MPSEQPEQSERVPTLRQCLLAHHGHGRAIVKRSRQEARQWSGTAGAYDGSRSIAADAVLIPQNDIQEGLIYPDAAFVFDIAKFAEAIHKKAYARLGSTDHLREGLLSDWRNQRLPLTRLAVVRHQQQYPSQTPFAGVEELIDEIGLHSLTATEHILKKQLREIRLLL